MTEKQLGPEWERMTDADLAEMVEMMARDTAADPKALREMIIRRHDDGFFYRNRLSRYGGGAH